MRTRKGKRRKVGKRTLAVKLKVYTPVEKSKNFLFFT